jgi:hypothetical protein
MRFRILVAALCVTTVCTAKDTDQETETAIDAVLVIGERPGPGLWKVTKGDHVMWVLGVQSPLARKMKRRSQQVEALIAQSQPMLGPGAVRTDYDFEGGFIDAFKTASAVSKFKKNSDEAKLSDVVSADDYAQWTRLKARFIGRDRGVEKLRPLFAAKELEAAALKGAGFDNGKSSVVYKLVNETAKEHKVSSGMPAYQLNYHFDAKRSEVVKRASISESDELECFRQTLAGLENKLDLWVARANAWAVGDLEVLRQLNQSEEPLSCTYVLDVAIMASAQGLPDDKESVLQRTKNNWRIASDRVRQRWLAEAEAALARNTVTFALLPMFDVVSEHGRLAALRAKGYTVAAPDDPAR